VFHLTLEQASCDAFRGSWGNKEILEKFAGFEKAQAVDGSILQFNAVLALGY